MAMKKIIHLDKKIITPEDYVKASFHKRKPIIGKPKVFINGKLVADEENLVVLVGREFFAQKVIGYPATTTKDYRKYESKDISIWHVVNEAKKYFKKGKAKVEIAVAKGKRQYDKRQVKKKRDWNRERSRYFRKTS